MKVKAKKKKKRQHWWSSFNTTDIGEGNGNRLLFSCLENSKDRESWWATVHGVAKGQIGLISHRNSTNITIIASPSEPKEKQLLHSGNKYWWIVKVSINKHLSANLIKVTQNHLNRRSKHMQNFLFPLKNILILKIISCNCI